MWQLLIPAISTVLDKVLPDAGKAQEAKAHLLEMQIKGELDAVASQIAVNLEEAKSSSVFVAGWRPFVGWICGFGLGYVGVLEPIARFTAKVAFGYEGEFPVIDTTLTMQVLGGMLGLGILRSADKFNGVAAK